MAVAIWRHLDEAANLRESNTWAGLIGQSGNSPFYLGQQVESDRQSAFIQYPSQQEAFSFLENILADSKGLGLLHGPDVAGKSELIEQIAQKVRERAAVAVTGAPASATLVVGGAGDARIADTAVHLGSQHAGRQRCQARAEALG